MTTTMTGRRSRKATLAKLLGSAALASGLLLDLAPEALARSVCMPHAEMARQPGERFSEAPIAIALASNGGLLEVYATGSGSTWTMVMTKPDGTSCVVASGEAWEARRRVARGPAV